LSTKIATKIRTMMGRDDERDNDPATGGQAATKIAWIARYGETRKLCRAMGSLCAAKVGRPSSII
jgi:hypothetical protein